MSTHEFTVSVEVEKTGGKFASRDDIEEAIIEALDGADPSSIEPGEGEYEVVTWEVEAIAPKGKAKVTAYAGRNGKIVAIAPTTGKGSAVDSRPLGAIPEVNVLIQSWLSLEAEPEGAGNDVRFERAINQFKDMVWPTLTGDIGK